MNIFICKRLFKCFLDDETRVLLKIEKGSSDSDFINASFIHVIFFLNCRYHIKEMLITLPFFLMLSNFVGIW